MGGGAAAQGEMRRRRSYPKPPRKGQQFVGPQAPEPPYNFVEVPNCFVSYDEGIRGSVLQRVDERGEWSKYTDELVGISHEAGRRRAEKTGVFRGIHHDHAELERLSFAFIAERTETDDPITGYVIRTGDSTRRMQGFCWYTTFTTWTHYFKWDSLSATAGLQGSANGGNISWDEDGALGHELEQCDRAGDPNGEGVIWPRVSEIALVGALECGGFLVQLILEELEASDQFDYVVVQATESSAGFYNKMGFRRVGAVARYAPRSNPPLQAPEPAFTMEEVMAEDALPEGMAPTEIEMLSEDVADPADADCSSTTPSVSSPSCDVLPEAVATPPLSTSTPALAEAGELVAYRHWAYPDEDVNRIDSSIMMALRLGKGEVHRRVLGDKGGILAHTDKFTRDDSGEVPPRGHNMPKMAAKPSPINVAGGGGSRRCHPWLLSKSTASHKKKRPLSTPSSPDSKRQAFTVVEEESPPPSRVTSKGRVVTPSKRFSWSSQQWNNVISIPSSPATPSSTRPSSTPSSSKRQQSAPQTLAQLTSKPQRIQFNGQVVELPPLQMPLKKPHRSTAVILARLQRQQEKMILAAQQELMMQQQKAHRPASQHQASAKKSHKKKAQPTPMMPVTVTLVSPVSSPVVAPPVKRQAAVKEEEKKEAAGLKVEPSGGEAKAVDSKKSAAQAPSSSSSLSSSSSSESSSGSKGKKTRKCPFTGVRVAVQLRGNEAKRSLFGEVQTYADIYCQGCTKKNKEKQMVLCDTCDAGWHMSCMSPPLTELPPGDWNCAACVAKKKKALARKRAHKAVASHGAAPLDKRKGVAKAATPSSTRALGAGYKLGDRIVARRHRCPVERFRSRGYVGGSS